MDKKKKAAAMVAVINYIKTEQEAIMLQQMEADQPAAAAAAPAPPAGMWGVSGRQNMMQMRSMMQLKAFHGIK
jgi:hypothetical protein